MGSRLCAAAAHRYSNAPELAEGGRLSSRPERSPGLPETESSHMAAVRTGSTVLRPPRRLGGRRSGDWAGVSAAEGRGQQVDTSR